LSASSVVYSLGVGEDISFDLSLIQRFGLSVYAFDPTPRAMAWVSRQDLPEGFHFMPYGIAGFDGLAKFYPPENPAHVSHTILRRSTTSAKAIDVQMRRLKTVMALRGHSRIDVLKMDIEGAEYEVIDDLIVTGIAPRQLLVEVHYGPTFGHITGRHVNRLVKRLNQYGYRIANICAAGKEYCFVREKV
jgi:FkbM family methyltransferase